MSAETTSGEDRAARSDVITDWRYTPTNSPHARQRTQEGVYYLERERVSQATQVAEGAEGGALQTEVRELFTAGETGVCRKDARDLLWENKGPKVNFHRYILSPRASLELETVEELQRWTRETMEEYGRHLGLHLHYVAAVHGNVWHPHAHVMIAGGATDRATGKTKGVRIGKADHAALKRIGRTVAARITAPTIAARDAARQRDMAALVERSRSRQQTTDASSVSTKEQPRESLIGRLFGRDR